jgi:hypothetical protein
MIADSRITGDGTLGFVQRELERVSLALSQETDSERQGRLYAVQQGLSWASDPEMFQSPYEWAMGIPAGLAGCP